METVKLTLSQNVYRRPDKTNEIPANGYLPAGSTIEVSEVLFGKEIEGNCIWYRAEDGYFYWSGGVETSNSQFTLPRNTFRNLPLPEQYIICKSTLQDFGDLWEKKYPEITVITVTNKKIAGDYKSYLSLVFHVKKKGKIESSKFPEKISYKGFEIPVDVEEAAIPTLCLLGDKVTKGDTFGTIGFASSKNNKNYLVTNYHVLCQDRILLGEKSLTSEQAYNLRSVAGFGEIDSGFLDFFIDAVAVETSQKFDNTVSGIGKISGQFDRSGSFEKFKPDTIKVQMRGATSQNKNTSDSIVDGTINSLVSQLRMIIPGTNNIHHFKEVIQLKMIAEEGDSGAPVLTVPDKEIIGILVASDHVQFSYVIPIETIIARLELKKL